MVATAIGNGGHSTAESPVYNPIDKKFYYVDIENGWVMGYDPATQEFTKHEFNGLVGGIAVNEDGRLIVALKNNNNHASELYFFDPKKPYHSADAYEFITQIEPANGNRPNDVNVVNCSDGVSRVFIGTMPINNSADAENQGSGSLYVLDPKTRQVVKLRDNLITTNGISGFSHRKGTQIFFSDSHPDRKMIYSAVFNPASNKIDEESEFLTLESGRPDGANLVSIHDKPCYGIACIDSGTIRFYDVATRNLVHSVEIPSVSKVTKFAISPEGLMLATTLMTKDDKKKANPGDVPHGHVFTTQLAEGFKPLNNVVTSIGAGEKVDVQLHPGRKNMGGIYPEEYRNSLKGKALLLAGPGEVYRDMLRGALAFLGVEVLIYYPGGKPMKFKLNGNERRIEQLSDLAQFGLEPKDVIAYIAAPNDTHCQYTRMLLDQGFQVGMEKPLALRPDLEEITRILAEAKQRTYATDFNFPMGRDLLALASGQPIAFAKDELVLFGEEAELLREKLQAGEKINDSEIASITASYVQRGDFTGGTFDTRPWLNDPKKGGVAVDMGSRIIHIASQIGLTGAVVETAELKYADPQEGYLPLEHDKLGGELKADHFMHATGKFSNGVPFDIQAGKFAKENSLFYQINYKNGDTLTLRWEPPHRKNTLEYSRGGNVVASIATKTDPYLLNAVEMFGHFNAREVPVKDLHAAHHLEGIRVIGDILAKGREPFYEKYGQEVQQGIAA